MLLREMFFPLACFPGAERRGLGRVDGRLEGFENPLGGSRKRSADEEVVRDAGESLRARVDQVLEVDSQHFGTVEPAEVGRKTFGDVGEFDIRVGTSEDADFQSRVKIGERVVVIVVDVARFHVGDVEDV